MCYITINSPSPTATKDGFWSGFIIMFQLNQKAFFSFFFSVSAVICAVFSITTAVLAQSSRPGWGATPYHDGPGTGVTFRVWAPNAMSVYLPGNFNSWSTTTTHLIQETTNTLPDGIWSADLAGVTNGSQYKYYFTGASTPYKNDPRARLVTAAGAGGNSIVYDPNAFNWAGDNFTNPLQNDLFIYELHIGTFPASSIPSKFVAATNKLDYLKSLGVNAVELMPIAEFGNSGSSWGYDPAQIFAADNAWSRRVWSDRH